MGMAALRGGMMTRTPEWRQPRMAPPRASTMKLTRNLWQGHHDSSSQEVVTHQDDLYIM